MPSLGSASPGQGLPRVSHFMGKDRPYHDGGGLCSPGRWPRHKRRDRFEEGQLFLNVAKELLKESVGGEEHIMDLMLSLAGGKTEESPFRRCAGGRP